MGFSLGDDFRLRHQTLNTLQMKSKDFTLSGDYRKLMGRAEDLSWETVTYGDPRANLQVRYRSKGYEVMRS